MGDDRVVVVEEDPVEAGVAGADVAHAEQGDHHEDEQLESGTAGDHRVLTIAGTSSWTRAGSKASAELAHGRAAGRGRVGPAGARPRPSRSPSTGTDGQAAPGSAGQPAAGRAPGASAWHTTVSRLRRLEAGLAQLGEALEGAGQPRHGALVRSPLARQRVSRSSTLVGSRSLGSSVGSLVGTPVMPPDRSMSSSIGEVGVVAHVQVAGDLRVAADDLVDERVGQEDVERLHEGVAGVGQLGEHRVELPQRLDGAVLRRVDDADADRAEVVERAQHLHQVAALLVERGQRARQLLERGVDRALLVADRLGQPVDRVDGVDDVGLVVVELGHELADLVEHRAGRALAAVERLVDLGRDRLELGDAAAVEDQAQRTEHLLDLGVAPGLVERDLGAVGELARGRGVGRRRRATRTSRRAGWSAGSRRSRWPGRSTSLRQLHRDDGVAVVEVDVGHLADADVVDLDRRLRDQVEHVAELGLDGDRVVADVGATGQRQLVDVEVAAGQQEHPDQRRPTTARSDRAAGRAFIGPPPRVRPGSGRSGSPERRRRLAGRRTRPSACLTRSHSAPELSAWPTMPQSSVDGSPVTWLTSSPRLALVSRVPASGL